MAKDKKDKRKEAYDRNMTKFLKEDFPRWVDSMPGGKAWVGRGQHFDAISHAIQMTVALSQQLALFTIDLSDVLPNYWLVEGSEGKMHLASGVHGSTLFMILIEGDTLQRFIERMQEYMVQYSIPLKSEGELLIIRDHRYLELGCLLRLLAGHRVLVGGPLGNTTEQASRLVNLVMR